MTAICTTNETNQNITNKNLRLCCSWSVKTTNTTEAKIKIKSKKNKNLKQKDNDLQKPLSFVFPQKTETVLVPSTHQP
jgi:hypothetical protein